MCTLLSCAILNQMVMVNQVVRLNLVIRVKHEGVVNQVVRVKQAAEI